MRISYFKDTERGGNANLTVKLALASLFYQVAANLRTGLYGKIMSGSDTYNQGMHFMALLGIARTALTSEGRFFKSHIMLS